MEQYFVNDNIFDILQEFGFIKTKEELINEERKKQELKSKGKKFKEKKDAYNNLNEDVIDECPIDAMKKDLNSLAKSFDNINKKLDVLVNLITKK